MDGPGAGAVFVGEKKAVLHTHNRRILILHGSMAFGAQAAPFRYVTVKEVLHKLNAVHGVGVEGSPPLSGSKSQVL